MTIDDVFDNWYRDYMNRTQTDPETKKEFDKFEQQLYTIITESKKHNKPYKDIK